MSLFPQQPEISLFYAAAYGKWIAAAFEGFMSTRLLLWSSTTADVRGPWRSQLIYTLPPPWSNGSRYYAYAPKLHPHLASGPNETVLSFASNAWDMAELFSARSEAALVYTPQMLRVDLASLLRPPRLAI